MLICATKAAKDVASYAVPVHLGWGPFVIILTRCVFFISAIVYLHIEKISIVFS